MKTWVALALLSLVAAAPQDSGRHRPTPKPQLHKSKAHTPAHTARRAPTREQSSIVSRGDGFTAAPTPNLDVTAPPVPENRQPHVAPTMFQLKNAYPGDGYVYGSSPQGMDDRKAATIPGVMLSVPLR